VGNYKFKTILQHNRGKILPAKRINVTENILNANDQIAALNHTRLNAAGVFTINLMASPGAGKTTLILRTIQELTPMLRIGVIEGDTAPVTIDADKILSLGMPAVQINTSGGCHLDANMVSEGINQLSLEELDLLMIENVGNLICPAAFKLGAHANVLIASVPEGDDKPYKYPGIYRGLQVLLISKIDLLPYLEFDMDYFRQGVEILNSGLLTFPVSAKTGQGFTPWIEWLKSRVDIMKKTVGEHTTIPGK
jgi:hydrogenase nickel incorporation protein HypB